jgi:hypothetical protein
MRPQSRSASTLLGSAVLALVALSAAAGAQTQRRTLSGRDVRVYDLVGAVTIESGNVSDVTVEVTLRGDDASRLRVETGTVRGVAALGIAFPDDDIVYPELGRSSNSTFSMGRDSRWGSGDDGWWPANRRVRVKGSGRGTEAWADMRIIVPAGRRVDVKVGVGSVSSRGVTGDLGLDVASAHVRVDGHTGTLRLDTGSGGAEISDVRGDELKADVGSGHVTVRGVNVDRFMVESGSGGIDVDQVKAPEITVDVGSGGVRVDRATGDRVRLETGSGGVSFELLNSPKSLDVEAGSGTVTLRLPADLDAELDIETGSGGIDSDFAVAVNRYERRRLRGTIGKGTGRIHVETGSGGVRLRKG